MENKPVKLKYPIKFEDKEYTELSFGRLKLKHIKNLPPDFADKWENKEIGFSTLIPIIAGLANIPEEVAEEIDIDDIDVIIEGLGNFFEISLDKTGKS